jgi:hypothetical protein
MPHFTGWWNPLTGDFTSKQVIGSVAAIALYNGTDSCAGYFYEVRCAETDEVLGEFYSS